MSKLMLLLGAVAGLGVGVSYWPRGESAPAPVAYGQKPPPITEPPPGPRQPPPASLSCSVGGTSFSLTQTGPQWPWLYRGQAMAGSRLYICVVFPPSWSSPAAPLDPYNWQAVVYLIDPTNPLVVGGGMTWSQNPHAMGGTMQTTTGPVGFTVN